MKTRNTLLGLLMAMVLLITACGGQQPATQAPADEPAPSDPTEISGTIKFAFPGEDVELKMG